MGMKRIFQSVKNVLWAYEHGFVSYAFKERRIIELWRMSGYKELTPFLFDYLHFEQGKYTQLDLFESMGVDID